MDQLAFDFGPPPPMRLSGKSPWSGRQRRPPHVLFYAAFLERQAARQATALRRVLQQKHGLEGTPVSLERLHVTLLGLAGFDEPPPAHVVDFAKQIGSRIDLPAFTAVFDRIHTFKGARTQPLVLTGGEGVAGFEGLHRALDAAVGDALISWSGRDGITPHVTLMYSKSPLAEGPIDPIGWRVSDFTLVHSLGGRTKHVPLKTWRLREPQ